VTAPRAEDGRPRLRDPVSESDRVRGPAQAPVTLVEYADYQCPHCQAAYPEIEQVLRRHAGAVRFAVRHFPVESSHPRALAAALAAEAAGRQGKFWEMHARLFDDPGRLEEEDLRRHATALGLDLQRFDADRADPELANAIRHQRLQGMRSGVNGTPTLFVNGLRYDGPHDAEALSRVIAQAAAP
jgi:protein-disulfide isomerase